MPGAAVVVTHGDLRAFIAAVLTAVGMPPARADLTAGLMVRTDLRGVDWHGFGMLPRDVEWWRDGYIVPDAEPVLVRDDPATALYDGAKGLGHYVSTLAMGRAIDKARVYGVGVEAGQSTSKR